MAAGAFGWSLAELKGLPLGELLEYAWLVGPSLGHRLLG